MGEEVKEKNDLMERTFDFAIAVIKFLRTIKYSKENDVIKYQLAKAATSVGANYEEAQAAFSKVDFNYKISISLREIRESNYWLRIIKAASISQDKEVDSLIAESAELIKIFTSIMKKIHHRGDV